MDYTLASKPYGNFDTATDLVIGPDPRLQKSLAKAEYVFSSST